MDNWDFAYNSESLSRLVKTYYCELLARALDLARPDPSTKFSKVKIRYYRELPPLQVLRYCTTFMRSALVRPALSNAWFERVATTHHQTPNTEI